MSCLLYFFRGQVLAGLEVEIRDSFLEAQARVVVGAKWARDADWAAAGPVAAAAAAVAAPRPPSPRTLLEGRKPLKGSVGLENHIRKKKDGEPLWKYGF